MKVEIKVPPVGESVSEATISNIRKASGSVVRRDEEIVEIETEKVNQVLYAPQAGLLELTVKVGDHVKIGQLIGTVDTSVQPTAAPASSASAAKPTPPSKEPSARQMAANVIGELKLPVSPPPSAMTGGGRRRMSALRKTIAQKLVEVKNTTAMLTTFNEVDMSTIISIRAKEKEAFQARYGVKLGFMPFFVKASVAALKAFPDIHAFIDGEDIVSFSTFDIGIAVSTDKGLMVPVVRRCQEVSFGEIEKQIEQFAKKARDGSITLDDLRGGSFTITNGGVFGSLLSTPILNPPQSGILGMHSIVKRPIVVEDQIAIRPMMYLALSYDHRIVDGKSAIQFLVHMKENLEDPTRLLLDL